MYKKLDLKAAELQRDARQIAVDAKRQKHGLGEFHGRRVQKPFPKPRTGELGFFRGTAHWMGPKEAAYVNRIQ